MSPSLTDKGIEAIRDRLRKAAPGPWKWNVFELGLQLEGRVEYPEMCPILIAAGCDNKRISPSGVQGCMPKNMDDPLRACPLHPRAEDRDFIAHAHEDIQNLLDLVNTLSSLTMRIVENAKDR